MNIHSLVTTRSQLSSPSPRPARASGNGDKSEAILLAALSLFVERGFHGTAVPEVAERAGVGAGTIYRYFASKEALVNVVFRQHKQALLGRLLADFPLHASTREQFSALWRRTAQYVAEEPLGFSFLELHHHSSYLDAESLALEQRAIQFGVAFVETAQKRGDLRPVAPAILIGIVLGAFIGLVSKSTQCGLTLDASLWTVAEQCVWEAIRI